MSTVQPIIATTDLARLRAFYTSVLGATETDRVLAEGDVFYLGLRIGDSDLGLVANADAPADTPQRILISVEVADVDALLDTVREHGGAAPGPPNDMPWGQRVAHVTDPDGNAVNLTHTTS